MVVTSQGKYCIWSPELLAEKFQVGYVAEKMNLHQEKNRSCNPGNSVCVCVVGENNAEDFGNNISRHKFLYSWHLGSKKISSEHWAASLARD